MTASGRSSTRDGDAEGYRGATEADGWRNANGEDDWLDLATTTETTAATTVSFPYDGGVATDGGRGGDGSGELGRLWFSGGR